MTEGFGDGEYLSLQFRQLGSAGIPVIKKLSQEE